MHALRVTLGVALPAWHGRTRVAEQGLCTGSLTVTT
jgi:hypothetical protein